MSSDKKRTRITNAAAAARANVTPRTLRRWCEDESMDYPEPFVVRGRIYFWLDEVEAFEARNPSFRKPERTPEEQAERAKPKAQKKAKPKREPAPKSPMQVMMVVPENLILPGNASTGYIKVSK
jgi:hypothetical protein